jgi:hypothetical protein
MMVQFNTDHNIKGGEKVTGPLREAVTQSLERYTVDIIIKVPQVLSSKVTHPS